MTVQQWKLAQTLGVVVQALDDLDTLLPAVAALGRRHTRYGVLPHHFDSVGAALLQAFVDTLGHRFTPAVRAAWSAPIPGRRGNAERIGRRATAVVDRLTIDERFGLRRLLLERSDRPGS